jgi:hypothetical protein
MNRTERIAVVLKGASLWGQWSYLQQYAGANASITARGLASAAQQQWTCWRDTQEPRTAEMAQAVARICGEILMVSREEK